jgi:hypothetical protein
MYWTNKPENGPGYYFAIPSERRFTNLIQLVYVGQGVYLWGDEEPCPTEYFSHFLPIDFPALPYEVEMRLRREAGPYVPES